MSSGKSFFELLQVAVGNRDRLTAAPSEDEWKNLFQESGRQSVIGITMGAVGRLPLEQRPSEGLTLRWAGRADKERTRNERMNELSAKLCSRFRGEGFRVAVLKGQANLRYYPIELRPYRTCGDIDVWTLPGNERQYINKVINYCQSKRSGETPYYHHIDFPVIPDTEVEVHYRPIWLSNPCLNRKLQKWFRAHQQTQDYEGFPVTTTEFDIVFHLLHIYKHLFQEGIGLRQIIDYYFTLTNGEWEKESFQQIIQELRVDKFCGAVMWVLGEVLGMKREVMPCAPQKNRGEHLLREIMLAGNFGKFDERNGDLKHESHAQRFWRKTIRSARLARFYPHEALWEPLFSIYHLIWRVLKLWKWE